MAPLSVEQHTELNCIPSRGDVGPDEARRRYDELKVEYQNDPVALNQIDRYDPESEYRNNLRALNEARESGIQKGKI